MKTYIIKTLILLLTFAVISCNKKNDPVTPDTPNTSTVTDSPLTNGLPANTNNVNGVYLAHHFSITNPSLSVYQSFASLNTIGKPLQSINPLSILLIGQDNGGTLKINNNILKFETTDPYEMYRYTDTTANPDYSAGVIWNLGGNASFNTFTTTVTRGFPVINNTTFLPLTISKTQSLTINFGSSNISNADSIIVEIFGPGLSVSKSVAGNVLSATFTASELSNATVGTANAQFFVYVKNYSNMIVNSKTHVFIMVNTLSGYADVNP